MAVDIFLKLGDIKGESSDAKHKNEIDIESFSWGLSQPGNRPSFQDFSFVMRVNRASPQLFLKCASGEHIKEALLTVVREGGPRTELLRIGFSDVLITGFQASTEGDEIPVDQVSFNFAKIEYEYQPIKADGSLDSPVKAGWDIKANKQI